MVITFEMQFSSLCLDGFQYRPKALKGQAKLARDSSADSEGEFAIDFDSLCFCGLGDGIEIHFDGQWDVDDPDTSLMAMSELIETRQEGFQVFLNPLFIQAAAEKVKQKLR